MNDFSLFILDLCQNSIAANASRIDITINEMIERNKLFIEIIDNGSGIPKDKLDNVFDPFYTTRDTRKVGLGIPLFTEAVKSADGEVKVISTHAGTTIRASMKYDHIDRLDIGDIDETLLALIINEKIDINFEYYINDSSYVFNTKKIKEILGNVPILDCDVLKWLKQYLEDELFRLRRKR